MVDILAANNNLEYKTHTWNEDFPAWAMLFWMQEKAKDAMMKAPASEFGVAKWNSR